MIEKKLISSQAFSFALLLTLNLLAFGCSEGAGFSLVAGDRTGDSVVDDGTDGGAFDPLGFDGGGDGGTDNPGDIGNPVDPPNDVNPDDPRATTDTFLQDTASSVDILFVIDDSGSMNEEQVAISDNATAFTQKLEDAAIDFHVAVITTNAASDAKLRSQCSTSDGLITPSTVTEFSNCAVVGINGSGSEEGMEASRRALDPNYVNGELNPGFLRGDAQLHIVYVSDEDDQPAPITACTYPGLDTAEVDVANAIILSELTDDLGDNGRVCDGREAYPPTLANHLAFFQGLKGAVEFTAHSVIIPALDGSDDCHRRTNAEEAGKRYGDFATMTGGSTSDVCGDWSATMDVLGLAASGLKDCFKLKKNPLDPEIIVALVNGVEPLDGFEYRELGNQVCFSSYPESGATVEISYTY